MQINESSAYIRDATSRECVGFTNLEGRERIELNKYGERES